MPESYPNTRAFPDENVMDGGTDMESVPSSSKMSQDIQNGLSQADDALGNAQQKAGDAMHNVRDKVRDKADNVTQRVKSTVSNAQRYVQESDARDMWGDVKELARRNPGSAMVAMAAIGFVLGRSTSRDSR